ncbi:MAG: serine/threonine protein kinase [Myxococcota bacterium]
MSASNAEIGSRVGPFVLQQPLALPGSGEWFRAERVTYSRGPNEVLVCVAETDEAERLLRDAHEALCTLNDPHWPTPVAWYDGACALAVTAPAGHSLASLLPLRASDEIELTSSTLLDLAIEVCDALVHAHSRGYVYGTVSPDHITIDPTGQVMLWGLGEQSAATAEWTPADAGPATLATDQWQLGTLIAALVSGVHPAPDAASLGRQWPALGRVVRRMTAEHPLDRYPTLKLARRELLALSRKAPTPSQRRALGAALHQHHTASPAPDTRSSMAQPPRIKLPLPSTKTPATELYEDETARPVEPRRYANPRETVPVVRPSVGAYLPTAEVSTTRPSFANIPISPIPTHRDIAVVAVEIDDTDHGRPEPLGRPMKTDDMPVPTAQDVFGGVEILDGDPLDPPASSPPSFSINPSLGPVPTISPSPLGAQPSGPTAVPTTDPGFGGVSMELDNTEGSFFSDAAAGVQGIPNTPTTGDEPDYRQRSVSIIETVAQGMMAANAALFALWFVVRVL